jgi:hypothetical protein
VKLSLTILLLLFASLLFGQKGSIRAIITKSDSLSEDKIIFIELSAAGKQIYSGYQMFDKPIVFDTLTPGIYSLSLRITGQRTVLADSLIVSGSNTINVKLSYPGLCPYSFSSDSKPFCLSNHTDQIIPVVYGYPNQSTIKKAKKGEVYLGGCSTTECDPNFYCKLHKRFL